MLLPRFPCDTIFSIAHETATIGDNGPESADAATMAAWRQRLRSKTQPPIGKCAAAHSSRRIGLVHERKFAHHFEYYASFPTTGATLPRVTSTTKYAQAMWMTQFLLPFVQYSVLQLNTRNRAIRRKFT